MIRICWWQPVLTAHQAHTIAALAKAMPCEVEVISSARSLAVREALGWTDGATDLPVRVLAERGWRREIDDILTRHADSIHIFGSPFERAKQNRALVAGVRRRLAVFLVSEPYSPVPIAYLADGAAWKERVKCALRPWLYRVYGALLRHRLRGVFAISPQAERQFAKMGIASERIFPFGYFVPLPAEPQDVDGYETTGPLRLAYLGSAIARKGVAVAKSALRLPAVRAADVRLTLFGPDFAPGPDRGEPWLEGGGALPFGQVFDHLAPFDALLVPSLYDGWAVVVNEAIGAGIPVIASDMVGAAEVVERWGCGMTFTSADPRSLADAIMTLHTDRAHLRAMRARTRALARVFQPEVAGAYMAAGLRSALAGPTGIRPPSPWDPAARPV